MFCLDQGVPLPRPAQAEVRLQTSSPPEWVGLQPHSQRATVASRTPWDLTGLPDRPLWARAKVAFGASRAVPAAKLKGPLWDQRGDLRRNEYQRAPRAD